MMKLLNKWNPRDEKFQTNTDRDYGHEQINGETAGTAYSGEDRDDSFIPSDNWLCSFIKKERSKFIKYSIRHAHMEYGV